MSRPGGLPTERVVTPDIHTDETVAKWLIGNLWKERLFTWFKAESFSGIIFLDFSNMRVVGFEPTKAYATRLIIGPV